MSWEFHYRGMVPKHHLVWKKQWTGFYIIVLLLIKWKKWCCSKFWSKGSCLYKNGLLKSIAIVIRLVLLLYFCQVCLLFSDLLFFCWPAIGLTMNQFSTQEQPLRSLKLPETKKSQEKEKGNRERRVTPARAPLVSYFWNKCFK